MSVEGYDASSKTVYLVPVRFDSFYATQGMSQPGGCWGDKLGAELQPVSQQRTNLLHFSGNKGFWTTDAALVMMMGSWLG